jgi:hypothetical protein
MRALICLKRVVGAPVIWIKVPPSALRDCRRLIQAALVPILNSNIARSLETLADLISTPLRLPG